MKKIPLLKSTWNKRKFRKGEKVKNLMDLVDRLERGQWIYLREAPKHPQILRNMSLATLSVFCKGGYVWEAVPNEDEKGGGA